MKNLIAAPVAVSERKELFAIDAFLWTKLCQWLPRQQRRLRRAVSYALMVGLLCQMALPITALAANEREGKRAREEAINKRREVANEKAKPAATPQPQDQQQQFLMAAVGLTLTQTTTAFNGLTGLGYHEANHQLLAAVNAPNGQPRNFELIAASGAHTAFSNASNLGGDLRVATARDDGTGKSLANFNRGELFFNTSAKGVIARVSANGATIQNPWIMLAGETGRVTGLTLDRTNVFSGHVIAVTATGRVYRVNAQAQATLVANLNTPLTGVTVLPNDAAKYGPWAGRILVGAPQQGLLYAVNAAGQSVSQGFGLNPSELHVIPPQQNLYGVDPLAQKIWGAPDEAFGTMVGDILIAQAQPGTLGKLRWNGSSFEYSWLTQVSAWQQLVFAPAPLAPMADAGRYYDKIAVVRHGLQFNSGRIEGAVWQLNPEQVQLNGSAVITSDLLVPGTPSVVLNGSPNVVDTIDGAGNPQPTNYQVRFNGNPSTRFVVRRVDAIAMPTITSPPSPTTTRDIQLNNNNTNPGNWATVRHVDINGSIAPVSMPPGTYDNISLNGNNVLILGVSGATNPVTYNLQEMQVNGSCEVRVISPVVMRVKNRFVINGGSHGVAATPSLLRLEIDNGNPSNALVINGSSSLYAIVRTPLGRVTLNGNSRLCGTVSCDELVVNGSSVLQVCETDVPPPPVNRPPTVNAGADQTVNLPATASLLGTVTDDGQPTGATLTTTWSKVSGPGNVTFSSANALATTASFDVAGTYTLKLLANDTQLTNDDEVTITVNGGNTAPTANAGADQTISLPTNLVNLSGTGSDDGLPSGSALTYVWSQITGPGTVTFGNANTAATSASFSTNGTYVLRLTVSDSSLTGTDDVTIVVNRAPIVNAGANQTIELPTNSVALAGSITDDGLPAGAAVTSTWTKLSGPGTVTFANAASATTTATFSTAGIYVLQLAASDTLATGSASVTITINASNQAPSVNAGLDQTISLPTNQVALAGSATDDGKPVGAALAYAWTKVSGPGTVSFSNGGSATTNATFSAGGVYILRLTVSDTLLSGSDDVAITVNSAPVVNAGADQIITLPVASATLTGTFTDDNLPTPVAYSHQWSMISGPGAVTFSNPTSLTTDATFGQGGVYVLKLTTSDSLVSGSDEITVIVNTAPSANAGPDQLISLPNATVALAGTGADPDSLPTNGPLTYAWTKVSGPGNVSFSNGGSAANAANTNATFSAAGAYTLRLTVSDSAATGCDDVIVIVNAAPVVNAGADQAINFNQTATLNGSASDDGFPTGAALSYAWSKLTGPGNVTFGTPTLAASSATFSASGVYTLRLSVSDTAATGFDDVVVTVNGAPTVNAGADQLITLPTNNVTLTSIVTDDGLAPGTATLTYAWSRASGPGTVTFSNATAANTTATFSAGGAYTLRLTVSDGALTTNDEINVIVNSAPTANAGPDQLISLPNNTATLAGTGADPDGLPTNGPLTFAWTRVSGPGTVTIANANAANTTATFSAAGSYTLRLTVSDSAATGSDDVVISVNAAPTVNAGPDQAINFNQTATLNGTASDPDGVPAGAPLTYTWSKLTGPGNVTFGTANAQSTSATFSASGVYTLRLSVSDSAATGADDIVVTVNGAPTVNAGLDQLITLPTNSVSLTPIVTDDGLAPGTGTVTYAWSKIGPGTVTFGNAAVATTTATFNTGGVYTLRLTVSDGALTSFDEIVITVNAAPVVSAGANRTVNIADAIALQGSATDDGLPTGSVLVYNWTKVSGSGNVAFANPNSATSGVSFSLAGNYVLRLAVSDSAATTTANVIYTVLPSNFAPVVNAGADQQLASIAVMATLQGTATDDGQPNGTLTVAWSKVSGPGTVTFSAPNNLMTSATFSAPGDYILRLTASDSVLTSSDDLVLTVNVANNPPAVDAGPNATVFFDTDNTAILNGFAEDPEGATPNLQWTKVNGPGTITVDDANSLFPVATFSAIGVYTMRLTASDGVSTVFDEVQVNVVNFNEGNQPPEVLMDDVFPLNWPANTFFNVQPIDVLDDGLPAGSTLSFSWRLVRGPGTATFSAPNAQVTNITFSAPGVYVVRLAVSDSQYVSEGDMELIVRISPTVYAGPDQTITLPTNTVNLAGLATPGVPIQGTLFPRWEKASGPGVVFFDNLTSPTATATFGKPGVYVLRLNIREGAFLASDDVTITVNAPAGNQPPLVSAGAPQNVVLPTTVTVLEGTVTDDGIPALPGLSVTWTQVSGPGLTTFDSPNTPLTSVGFSEFGTYVLRLTATDGVLTTFDDVTVSVFTVLRPLFVDAGLNQYVDWNAGGRHVNLEATVIDDSQPARAITSQKWTVISGPGTVTFTPFNTIRRPLATFSAPGTYVLRFTATAGAEQAQAFDDVTIYALTNNQPPVIDPIAETVINWPTNQTSLAAIVSDDGLPAPPSLTTSWRLVRGPGTVTFNPATGTTTNATFSVPGRYWLRVAATDTQAIGEQNLFVSVNQLPFVNAGPDATISLPNTYIMQATATDDGLPLNESGNPFGLESRWTQIGGPATANLSSFSDLNTTVAFPLSGTYVFELKVSDKFGANQVSDQVTITVLPQNRAPIVNAGADRAITLPTNLVALAGSVIDDGYPAELRPRWVGIW